ncbi:hypothetical protein [Candidatus Sneabacter namystus]|uniref:Uncharacterized protein n=1 Tax=Candidatus Sneabacter namystus TaxID=2601646 RepID=A0A5C0UHG1_9RICK|nr:hypothetical protein [Candidatus Sneabacter namystus]QEK39585.1 hypothetical protein FZC37_01375 [Candidatus Sneabacter namystus]
MLTLFASLIGFFGSIFPEIIKLFREKSDKAHELKILEKQMEYNNMSIAHLAEIESDIASNNILYKTYKTNILWIDALNGTVRPVLAYGFFIIYAWMKIRQSVIASHLSLLGQVGLLWTENDQAIFAGIISFYFGQRTFSKLRKSF